MGVETAPCPLPPEEGGDAAKLAELRYAAVLEVWKQEQAEKRELAQKRTDEEFATENELRATVHGAYLEVATAALERGLKRATFVTGAAGTMATIYTGLLALVYSVAKDSLSPMPASGIGAAAFLGISFVLSTVYVAFINRSVGDGRHLPTGIGSPQLQEDRLATFIEWTIGSGLRRAWALRSSVFSLGIGVALTPVPFLRLAEWQRWCLIAVGAVILLGKLVHEWVTSRRTAAAEDEEGAAAGEDPKRPDGPAFLLPERE